MFLKMFLIDKDDKEIESLECITLYKGTWLYALL